MARLPAAPRAPSSRAGSPASPGPAQERAASPEALGLGALRAPAWARYIGCAVCAVSWLPVRRSDMPQPLSILLVEENSFDGPVQTERFLSKPLDLSALWAEIVALGDHRGSRPS